MIEAGKKLRVIGRAGIGVDNVDLSAATARGIIVMNTPEGNTITTAEHAISLMTSLARKIPAGHGQHARGQVGEDPLQRQGALRPGARRDRARQHRLDRRRPRARAAHARDRIRPARLRGARGASGRGSRLARRADRAIRRHHRPRSAHREHARPDRTGRLREGEAGRPRSSMPRAAGSSTSGRCSRRSRAGSARVRRSTYSRTSRRRRTTRCCNARR